MFLVVARVHAHLDGPVQSMMPAEDEIVARIANVFSNTCKSFEESSRIWKRVKLKLIAAKKGHSIVLYIWCKTMEELLRLQDLLTIGHLKDTAEQLFNQLLTLSQKVTLKDITMDDEEFKQMKLYFTGDQQFRFKVLTLFIGM